MGERKTGRKGGRKGESKNGNNNKQPELTCVWTDGFFFKPFLFHQGISITFKAVSHLFKCVFWQSCQRLGKSFFMEIIKRKRSRQEACSSLAVRVEQNCVSFKIWKYLKHQWNTWSTFLLPGSACAGGPLPCPSHSHYNWKFSTCCWLE